MPPSGVATRLAGVAALVAALLLALLCLWRCCGVPGDNVTPPPHTHTPTPPHPTGLDPLGPLRLCLPLYCLSAHGLTV